MSTPSYNEPNNYPGKEVKVADAKKHDVGLGIAKIDPDIAMELGISKNDIIEIISSRKKTAVKNSSGYPDDRSKGIIRIDGATQRNADTSIDENVFIRKIDAKDAVVVYFSPVESLRIRGGERYLRKLLNEKVLTVGDFIDMPIMGRNIVLEVTNYDPKSEAVIVRDTTQIEIKDKKSKENNE